MKYYLIAGEASGDLHGANLISEIKKNDATAQFRFFGGDLMQNVGGKLTRHYRELAFMGIFEVLANLSKIKENFRICKQDILDFDPDAVILIDYPGFNLKMAKFAKENNIKTIYYISPKIWVWKEGRIKQIKKYVDKMFVIFPFETDFYKKHAYQVEYVGNPVVDALKQKTKNIATKEEFIVKYNLRGKPIIALLAGSRKQEVKKMLPFMSQVRKHFPDYDFVIAGAPGIDAKMYKQYLGESDIKVVFNDTYQLLSIAHAAVVNSGTATLETALLKIPQVVCYKMAGGKLLYLFGYHFYGIRYTSLVNIILQKEAVKELIQHLLTPESLLQELKQIIENNDYRQNMIADFNEIEHQLGGEGASSRTAISIVKYLKKTS